MTPYDYKLTGTLRTNPNITPSFKKGDCVILLKDSMDPRDPKGPTNLLVKGYIFEIECCGLSQYIFSPPKFNSEGEFIEGPQPLHVLNDVEWCIIDIETNFCSGALVKTENCRLATEKDFENEEF